MLKAKRHELYSYEQLVKKPHFLPEQRWKNFSTMDSSRRLVQVIMDMQHEINQLESENRALRGGLGQSAVGSVNEDTSSLSSAFHQKGVAEESAAQSNLRRNVSAPALEGPFRVSSNAPPKTKKKQTLSQVLEEVELKEQNNERLQGNSPGGGAPVLTNVLQDQSSTRPPSSLAKEKLCNRRSLKEHIHKNRTKVKSVTFLLPVEDSSTTDNHRPTKN
ncbi:putative coiled-coil domain-containing protein 195 [Lepisosteus oculatus]|uniref:putative coiled-coil domain-containing protein 195 n=1 Tax=Lepisosteus oculatus TaxID=7918 RepID=UPI0035F50C07